MKSALTEIFKNTATFAINQMSKGVIETVKGVWQTRRTLVGRIESLEERVKQLEERCAKSARTGGS